MKSKFNFHSSFWTIFYESIFCACFVHKRVGAKYNYEIGEVVTLFHGRKLPEQLTFRNNFSARFHEALAVLFHTEFGQSHQFIIWKMDVTLFKKKS